MLGKSQKLIRQEMGLIVLHSCLFPGKYHGRNRIGISLRFHLKKHFPACILGIYPEESPNYRIIGILTPE